MAARVATVVLAGHAAYHEQDFGDLTPMEKTFCEALRWHMERHGTGVAELARATGVSPNVIKKMRTRAAASTTAENAVAISRYYGKAVGDFIVSREDDPDSRLLQLLDLLSPEQRRMLESQVKGLLRSAQKP